MKKVLILLVALAMASTTCMAQSYADLLKAKKQQDKLTKESLDFKPTSEDKKQAKQMKKEGWTVKAGDDPMEVQFCRARMLKNTPIVDEASGYEGMTVNRYIMWTSIVTAGDESTASDQALFDAQSKIAAQIETKIASAMESKKDNQQNNVISATTVNKFHKRSKAIVDVTLNNTQTPVSIYRVLPNYNCQVQLQVAFDKMELKRKLMQKLREELEQEGDEDLGGIVDEVLNSVGQ